MGIWVYQDYKNENIATQKYQNINGNINYNIIRSKRCIFCNNEMQEIFNGRISKRFSWNRKSSDFGKVKMCMYCGWWTVLEKYHEAEPIYDDYNIYREYGATAILKKLDLNDISTPIDDIIQYLKAKYEDRFDVNPRLFEEIVASVFRNMGYYVRVTAYQKDGGIDVILDGKENKTIGIQVKRYKNSIKVSQIREFAGALIENNITKGIFVTTSNFQRGSYNSVLNFKEKGIAIELFDSEKFYEALQIKKVSESQYQEVIDSIINMEFKLVYKDDDYERYIKE